MRKWLILIGGICVLLGVILVATDNRSVAEMIAFEPTVTSTLQTSTTRLATVTQTPNPELATVTAVPSSTAAPKPTVTPEPMRIMQVTATPTFQQVAATFRGTCYTSTQTVDVFASASGTAANSRDDAGNTVTYDPNHLLDCNSDTAWRVEYALQPNPTLSFRFSRPAVLTRIGFVPGYDKRDPLTNQWRWYQNRRISEVSVILNYQDGQTCTVYQTDIPDSPDALWINLADCRPAQNGVEWLVNSVDLRVDYSRPPSVQPIRNFVVVSDVFFEGFTYEQ